MCERLHVSPDEALRRFALARPPGIKHKHFQDALRERYDTHDTDTHTDTHTVDADASAHTSDLSSNASPNTNNAIAPQ